MYWYVYDIANLLNRFRLPCRSPRRFFVYFFLQWARDFAHSLFSPFQVKRCPLLRAMVINSLQLFPWLGGSLHSIPLDCFVVITIFFIIIYFLSTIILFYYDYWIMYNYFYSQHNCWVRIFRFQAWWFVLMIYDTWIFRIGIWIEIVFYIVFFLAGGLGSKYRWNSVEFSIDFRELGIFLKSCHVGRVGIPVFQTGYDIIMSCRFLVGFRETRAHSRTHSGCHMSTFGSRPDIKTLIT